MDGYKITVSNSLYERDIKQAFATSKSASELLERLKGIGEAHGRNVTLKLTDGSEVVIE